MTDSILKYATRLPLSRIKHGNNPRRYFDQAKHDVACCRFGGHRDRLIQATPASRSKSIGLR